MRNKFILSLLGIVWLGTFLASLAPLPSASASQSSDLKVQAVQARKALAKNHPHEHIYSIRTADLNNDKKYESFMLTEAGNFFLYNSKGYLIQIATEVLSDEGFENPTLQVFAVSPTEKQIATFHSYGPSNTWTKVYRLQGGTLVKTLDVMGDQGVEIDSKGRIHQHWKKYREFGGWFAVEAVYTWNAAKQKYTGTGMIP